MARNVNVVVLAALGLARAHPSWISPGRSKFDTSYKYASVQVGGNGRNDVHARYEKDIDLLSHSTHLTAKFHYPDERLGAINSMSLSGRIGAWFYEATRAMGQEHNTDLQLACSLPSGAQLWADAKTGASGPFNIDRVSAFHVAGPFNVQPSLLLSEKVLRLVIGRGGMWNSCPISVQTDLHQNGEPTDVEVGMRHEFNDGRKLRARLCLPGQGTARLLWAEYQDAKVDEGAVWFAKARLPLGADHQHASGEGLTSGLLRRAEFSLRRAWQF